MMIVTIDGPAGAGKSSVARALAGRLGFRFLDTGALYRAVVWAALDRRVHMMDPQALESMVENLRVEFSEQAVTVDGRDVTGEIREPRVAAAIHHVADNPRIRARLVQWQRRLAEGSDVVTEGRDQGTVAFPDAACKIFLTASREERARRRFRELSDREELHGRELHGGKAGESVPAREPELTYEDVLAQQDARDRRDRERPVGALRAADDARVVRTDQMCADEVVEHLEQIVRQIANERTRGA